MTDRRDGDEIVDLPPPTSKHLTVVKGAHVSRIDRERTTRDNVWIRMDTNLDLTVTSACRQLAKHPNIYARSGRIVEVLDGSIRDLPLPTLRERLCEVANFFRPKKDKGMEMVQPNERIVQSVLSRGSWRSDGMRDLVGVTTIPMLRHDGSLVDTPGYDIATGYVYAPSDDLRVGPVAEAPTWEQARAALAELVRPIALFPFRRSTITLPDGSISSNQPVAISAYLAMLLTTFVRHLLPNVPAFGISATTPGTGKTRLTKIPGWLFQGCAVNATKFPETEVEVEKTIAGFMADGSRLILFDNVRRPVDSDTLCIVTTSADYAARVLGRTQIVRYPNAAILLLTGNNVVYVGDMCRRVVPIELVAADMAPERRRFTFDPEEYVQANRSMLVRAALTVLRAWIVADRPQIDAMTLGSFEAWARFIPQVLAWLNLPNPLHACTSEATQDTTRGSVLALALAWEDAEAMAGHRGLCVQQVLRLAYPELPKGLPASPAAQQLADRLEDAIGETGRAAVAKKLPYVLRAAKGRILDEDGRRFEGRQDRTKLMHWSVLRG